MEVVEMKITPFINVLAVLLIITFVLTPTISITPPPNYPVAKQGCDDRCANISIPFPFGTTPNCYHSHDFLVTCNHTFNPPKLFIRDGNVEIQDISLDGQMKVLQFIAHYCYDRNGRSTYYDDPYIDFPKSITVNYTANKFTVVGCDTSAYIHGKRRADNRNYTTGCTATCDSMEDLEEGSCNGLGWCQNDIPRDVWMEIDLSNYDDHTNVFNHCGHAFLAEQGALNFSRKSLTNLSNVKELPMVADWAIGNGTCDEAKKSSSYACVSINSTCYKPGNGDGYRCRCEDGYEGNPYLIHGCRDECKPELNTCKYGHCENTKGSYNCNCRKGYNGDGKKYCSPGESLLLKLVAGISLGVTGLLLALFCLYLDFKRRILNSKKQKFFLQNGGELLREEHVRRERSQDMVKIFSSSELEKATNNFHSSMIIGQGGFGTVYKGLLPDNNIIAIKKSKRVDPNQNDQFINEVIVLSQINHRNVVRLLGCCLETEVPLLVYEFIENGTLAANIHNQAKARFINWSMRLKIAAETAGVLSYFHSAAFTPIIHRDVKSDNILLDHNFTAKVSDFGASRFVPLDKTQLSTMVQGTFGYLDPEYMQTNQLTEKSDVYSFGVVLVELLTGRKALSFDRPEDEHNLANFFLSVLKKEQLLQVLDDNIVGEGNMEQVTEVAMLAQECLHVKGEDRPSMKEVAMELESLRLDGKHLWAQTEQNAEETESLIGEGFYGSAYGDGNSSNARYDSLKDHVILPVGGGR